MSRDNVFGFWAGAVLIVLGILFLLGQMLQVNVMRFLWPVFILVVGASFFIAMAAGGRALGALAVPGSVITTIGLILFFQNLLGLWSSWAYAWTLIIAGAGVGLILFGMRSELPDLRRAGQVVVTVGLVLFFVFGLLFELGASLLGARSPGGAVWAILLILAGVYIVLSRTVFSHWTEGGPVSRSAVEFSTPAPTATRASLSEPEAALSQAEAAISATQNSEPVTSEASMTGIRKVRFHALGDITILQGEREGLEIEANQAFRERIRAEVLGDTLEIRYDQSWLDWLQPRYWSISNPIRYTLYLRNLEILDAAGLGNTTVPALTTGRLEVTNSGAGQVTIRHLTADELIVHQKGLGNIEIDGRVTRQDIHMSGAGSYHAGRLESSSASVRLSGLGSANVWARESLDGQISGAGSIEYYGSPRINESISGLGSMRRMGDR